MTEKFPSYKNHPVEQNIEKEEELPEDVILDILCQNYIDKEGNMTGWQEFEYSTGPHFEALTKQLKKTGANDLEEFLYNSENLESLIKHYGKTQTTLDKVKLIKIIGDITESVIRDEEDEDDFVKKSQDFLQKITRDKDTSYFVSSYAQNTYLANLESENWYTDEFEEVGKVRKMRNYLDLHDDRFDSVRFNFTPEIINKINYASRDYGAPTQIMNSFEALPLNKTKKNPYFEGDKEEHIVYEGDYLTTIIAPDVVGIFSKDGTLIGWQSFEKENIQNMLSLSKQEQKVFDHWDAKGAKWEEVIKVLDKENQENKLLLQTPAKLKNQIAFKNQEEDLALFKILSSLPFRLRIKEDFGINLSDFSLRNQYQFLQYIKNHKTCEVEKIHNFFDVGNNEAINRMKAFLSLEIDFGSGDKIILLRDKLPKEKASSVFAKISQLVDLAEKEEKDYLQMILSEEKTKLPNIQRIFLEKAHRIILDFSQSNEASIDKLLKDLESSRTEIILLSSLVKTLKGQQVDFGIENIKDLKLETREIGDENEFSQELKKTVLDMAGQSYSKIYADNPAAYEKVMRKFKTRLENIRDYRVYMLTFQNELVAFCTMQPTEENPKIVMAESLIADPEAQKSSAGMLFAKASLEMELARPDVEEIRGETRVNNPANEKYKQLLGFEFEKDENGKEKPTIDPDTEVAYFKMSQKK